MENTLAEDFVEKLIKTTIVGINHWLRLQRNQTSERTSTHPLYSMLLESEFREIKYEDSFALRLNDGGVYLLHECCESGKDGAIFDGYNLYLHPTKNEEPSLVLSDTQLVYRLRNVIEEKLGFSHEVVDFMKDYLKH